VAEAKRELAKSKSSESPAISWKYEQSQD